MPLKRLFLLSFLCGCTVSPLTPTEAQLTAEPTLWVEQPITLKNLAKETLVIGDIGFRPDEAPVRWTGPGPFEVEPGEVSEIVVRFSPMEVGEWSEKLVFTTNAGELTVPLTLRARVGLDVDQDGWSIAMGDCHDGDPTRHPNAQELCNAIDDNCDGEKDEDFDTDHDGFLDAAVCPHGLDCNDADPTAHPDREEECDQTDSDCNGFVDDINHLADLQQGVCEGMTKVCPNFGGPVEPDYTLIPNYEIKEGSCDGLDNDCDGDIDGFDYQGDGTFDCIDDDGDGQSEVEGDCDDQDASVKKTDCGPQTLGATSLEDGFTTVDLNIWTSKDYPILGGTYQGSALRKEEFLFVTRVYKSLLHVELDPFQTISEDVFSQETMAVLPSRDREAVHILLRDGRLVTRSLTGEPDTTITMTGDLRAMRRDGEHLWVCSSDGHLHKVHPEDQTVESAYTFTSCYGPPVVDSRYNRIIVAGYFDYVLTTVDRDNLSVLGIVATDHRVLRGTMVDGDLWISSGVDKTVEVRRGKNLVYSGKMSFDTPVQGLWHDPVRQHVWAALQDTHEIVAIDVHDNEVVHRVTVNTPVSFFPVEP